MSSLKCIIICTLYVESITNENDIKKEFLSQALTVTHKTI